MDLSPSIANLLAHSLLIISGKGGTGKSLIAATLALIAAEQGKRVLLVENTAQSQLMPLLGTTSQLDHQETWLRSTIWGINLNSQDCFREYIVKYLGLPRLYDTVFKHKTVQSFTSSIPGLGESMILGRLLYTCRIQAPPTYDLLIFDAPASGHFLSMLHTPDTIIDALKIGPLVTELRRVRDFLADPVSCAGLFVTTTEELVVSETLEFLPQLAAADLPLHLQGVVINRVARSSADDDALLREFTQAHPEIASLATYCQERTGAAALLEAKLVRSLFHHRWCEDIFTLPDLGPIAEPLTSTVASILMAGFRS